MVRETAAEREHRLALAKRRRQYKKAKEEEQAVEPEQPAVSQWQLPDPAVSPGESVVVEVETGHNVMKARHVGGVWKPVDSDQAVNIRRWRYIGKKR